MKVMLTCHVRFASAMAWYTLHLARGLQKHGIDVFLSAQRGSPLAVWAGIERIPGSYDRDFHSANPLEIIRSLQSLRSEIQEFRPDILNPHCPPGHVLLAAVNRGKLPLIRTVAEPRGPKRHLINRVLHERFTDGIIYSTESSVSRYSQAFRLSNTLEKVVYPGLDLTLFPEVANSGWREKLGVPANSIFAAIVARMSPEKGQEILIESLGLLDKTLQDKIVVLLTGDDNRQRSALDLKQLAEQNGTLNCIRFEPRLADVRPLLNEIDLGIITSTRSEAVCRIALEYMAYDKPIISSDVNILPEVVRNKVNGLIVSTRNPAELAGALRYAIENQDSLKVLGVNGGKLLRSEFTLEAMTSGTVEFYNRVKAVHG